MVCCGAVHDFLSYIEPLLFYYSSSRKNASCQRAEDDRRRGCFAKNSIRFSRQ